MLRTRREDIIDKILARVEIVNAPAWLDPSLGPCKLWTGPTSGKGRGGGYGRMNLDGQTVAVHLAMFTCHYGYIPSKKQVDHLCNRRLCVSEMHFDLVTHKQNQLRRDL